jgi:hypothetical protein
MKMAHHSESGDQVKPKAHRGSCCDMSPAKPVPASVPLASSISAHAGIVTMNETAAVPLPNRHERQRESVSLLPVTSSQATLCTFLI